MTTGSPRAAVRRIGRQKAVLLENWHLAERPAPRVPGQSDRGWRLALRKAASWLWALSPLSAALGPAPTFAVIAVWKRSWRYAALAAGYGALTITAYVLYRTLPEGDDGPVTGIMLPLTGLSLVQALLFRRRLFALPKRDKGRPVIERSGRRVVLPPPRQQPALTRALRARELRREARELVANDPALADELGVGRPELHRGFDDGGLIDVNHASPEAIVAVLGLEDEHVGQIIDRRGQLGGFTSVADLGVHTDVPPAVLDRLAERLLFLADS